jgi:hypothetical protein
MELHHHLTIMEAVMMPIAHSGLPGIRRVILPLVSNTYEQFSGPQQISRLDQNVQIPNLAEGELTIHRRGEGGSLVWDRGDLVALQQADEADQFTGQAQVVCGVLLQPGTQGLQSLLRRQLRGSAVKTPGEERQHPVG